MVQDLSGKPEDPRMPRPEERPLSTEETVGFAVGDPFNIARHGCSRFFQPKKKKPKKKSLPVPGGVKFIYFGKHSPGVVTVAWIESSPGTIVMGFSFCSPKDRWCKITGREIAVKRLYERPVVIPCLYSPKRTVHEVVRAVLTHDFIRIAALAPGATMWGAVPSWTRRLGARMEAEQKDKTIVLKMLQRGSLGKWLILEDQ